MLLNEWIYETNQNSKTESRKKPNEKLPQFMNCDSISIFVLLGETISYHYTDNAKNEGGLLATLTNHDQYLKALEGVMHKT